MNTQQLQCFLRVADKLNFTKAAKELYLSTPTITHHIQSLEIELEAKLFIRNTKSVQLTETGKVFYHDATDLLSKFDLARKHAAKINEKESAMIRIGCSSYGELNDITMVLKEFKKEYDSIYPQINITNHTELISMLDDNQIDIVFGTKDMMTGFSGYTFKPIKKIMNYAVVSTDHPLSIKDTISFDELHASCLLTLHPKMVPFKYENKIQEAIHHHAKKQVHIVCKNDQTSIALASANYGVAILPEFCIPSDFNASIKKILLAESEAMEYGIAYQDKGKDPSIVSFIKLCTGNTHL